MLKFIFTVGLPGSGKTTYCKKISRTGIRNLYFDADNYEGTITDLTDELKDKFEKYVNYSYDYFIYVDGMFISEDIQKEVVEAFRKNSRFTTKFIIFLASTSVLLYNDNLRVISGEREKNSAITINNSRVDINYINQNKLCQSTINVQKFDYFTIFYEGVSSDFYEGSDNGCINSEKWSTGGTYGTCWDEHGPTPVDADCEGRIDRTDFHDLFVVLDKLYNTKVDENIAEFYDDLFDTDTDYEDDYYGGCQNSEFRTVSIERLVRRYHNLEHEIEEDFDYDLIKLEYPQLFI